MKTCKGRTIALVAVGVGVAMILVGLHMKDMTVPVQKTTYVTHTDTHEKDTRARNAGIGAALGGSGGVAAGLLIGGIGIATGGIAIGIGAVALGIIGAVGGGVAGAATGSHATTVTTTTVPVTEIINVPRYTDGQVHGMIVVGAVLVACALLYLYYTRRVAGDISVAHTIKEVNNA